ncbi:DNA repair protein RecN [Ruminococcus gauvreauii]|uniref:DNA repair protein RecN n=1 Tax=Ruminococcus gauvreauii TaxID=438033 RepID=A0ABY5VJ00_9FIRM|nr:DNA repair protein RecN [Ruminococcus gauvreauii]UWP59870.1 DNA repair protein RecN [Ruminococcus gauvreauii]
MLTNLHVKNIALIDEVEVDFERGLNILTGETGAGKSILLDSVNLALGKKMASDSIGKFGDSALVELIFTVENPRITEELQKLSIVPEDGQVILSRKIMEGRSISRINGETCTVSQMKAAASLLLDIHGQHEHQSLLYPEKQLEILDEFAGEPLKHHKQKVAECYHAYQKLSRKLQACSIDEEQRQREVSFLEFEIHEIDEAKVRPGEDEELERLYRKLSNSRKIVETLQVVYEMTGYDNPASAGEVTGRVVRELSALNDFDEELSRIYSQALDIESMLNDLNRDISGYLGDLTFSEELFAQTEARLDEINRLKGKYGENTEKILNYRDEQQKKLDELLSLDERRAELAGEQQAARERLEKLCEQLCRLRKHAARELEKRIVDSLRELNFLQVEFEIAFKQLHDFSKNGNDNIEFLISTNPGEEKRSLSKVVSGGELSRIMLAVKTLMADKDDTEVLIFDEIDTGISGRTAQKVAEKMAEISRQRQVLCITHLPQIAAMADAHFEIEKNVQDTITVTRIKRLDEQGSMHEIARMLGGTRITQSVLSNACEMKELAQVHKNTRLKN